MDVSRSFEQVAGAGFSSSFVRPLPDSYGFSGIPHAILALLGAGKGDGQDPAARALPAECFGAERWADLAGTAENVVFLYLDAFGWRWFERVRGDFEFLRLVDREGFVSQLTAQFPSTTAAHVTCAHTGLNVAESGVYEWYYYEPRVDAIICPLKFSYADDRARGTLAAAGISPEDILPRTSIHQRLAAEGVATFVLGPASYTPSPYTLALAPSATMVPYGTLAESLVRTVEILENVQGRKYLYIYHSEIDGIGHRLGPGSRFFDAEITAHFATLDRVMLPWLSKRKNTVVFLTADHGMSAISPERTFYLNRELPELLPWLVSNRAGRILAPAGSARDFFLHVREEHRDECLDLLRRRLDGIAEVYPTAELIAQNIFGSTTPGEAFLSRVGNVVILPLPGEAVWWFEEGRFVQDHHGQHGGLSRDEMEIPFLVLRS